MICSRWDRFYTTYMDKEDHEVEKLYRQYTFPEVTGIPLGDVITKCWMGKYQTASQVLRDIRVGAYLLYFGIP